LPWCRVELQAGEIQTVAAWTRSQLTAASRHARRRMWNVEGWRRGLGARPDRRTSGKPPANRADAIPRAERWQSSLCQSWRRLQGRTSFYAATVSRLHEPDICHPPAPQGALRRDGQLPRRCLWGPSAGQSPCTALKPRQTAAHVNCFASTGYALCAN
jgi:hypothetical protein